MSVTDETTAPPATRNGNGVHLGWAVAGLSAGAGAIHLAMVPSHAGSSLVDPIGFAVVGWFQLLVAGAILADRAGRNLYRLAVVGNLAVLGLWIWSRTVGLPAGSHSGVTEEVGAVDGMAAILQVGIVLLAGRILLAPEGQRVAVGRVAPVLAAVAALGLATTVITSSDAAEHGGADHDHGDEVATAGHTALMAELDATRCDRQFNPPSYWAETEYLGVDTYQGGAMSAAEHNGEAGGHDHGGGAPLEAGATTTTDPDPTEGRGSQGLDVLITATDRAGSGAELDAAALVSRLAEASDDDYQAWLWWLRNSGVLSSGHDHDAAAPDDAGHGGHVGPQPWIAMTDQAQCDQLAEELDLARETAMKYPTAADAKAAGWARVTPYVPGIAAHYMNFEHVDGTFDIEAPEMLLYDGNGDDAAMVGLSYYILHDGDAEPSQGFTGPNDHFHRHVGLCVGAGGVIGDSSTTKEDCEARGGTKSEGSNGWMNHVWIVPGCESPWGMFSGATPVLDGTIATTSGQDGGGCAGSSVRDRYDMDEVLKAEPISNEAVGG